MNAESSLRSSLRLSITIVALVMGPPFVLGPLAIAVMLGIFAPLYVSLPLGLVLLGLAALFAYLMSGNLAWVEIHGSLIRARYFWTRQTVERSVADIARIKPLFSAMGGLTGLAADALLDKMLGTSNRGYELHFRDGLKLALIRADMTNVDSVLRALHRQLGPRWGEVVG
jgi:hypothetical protein